MAEAKPTEAGTGKMDQTLTLQPLTDAEREQAQQATREFEKGNFDAAAGSMNKLATGRSSDPKISHNKAVLDYYRSGLKKTDEFKKALSHVCIKAQVNLESVAALDDVDQCVIYYNHAVILYYLKRYRQAILIMDKLFQFIEPMEESLSRKVMFLLLDLYLCTQQPEKAMGMLAFIEKSLFGNGKAQSPDKEIKSETSKEATHAAEMWKPKFSQYKARVYLMLRSLKTCKRELKNLMNTMGNTCPVVYLKSNFEYLRGNYKKAMKVMNSCPQTTRQPADTGEHGATMYYNNLACIHFNLRKHHLGAFYLRKALQENENISKEVLGKVDTSNSISGKPVQAFSVSRHYELLHNMGVQLLHCGKPQAAFDCLVEVVQVYHVNPRLWLRLAECCIMAHRMSNEEDRLLSKRLQVIQRSVGTGIHRKLILGTGVKDNCNSSNSAVMPVATLEFASLCLRNALLLLTPDESVGGSPTLENDDASDAGKHNIEGVSIPAPPSNPIRGAEVNNLRCSVLCQGAYVALCLHDYTLAQQHAEKLLKIPKLSGAHKYLGHMYLSEALVALDHLADAIGHLNPDVITDINTVLPEQRQDLDRDKNGEREEVDNLEPHYPWSPNDIIQAKAIMQYNLATAYTIRGEYERASLTLTKSAGSIGNPLPAQMYFLKLYLELMEGRRKTAQTIIKDHFGHITPNRM